MARAKIKLERIEYPNGTKTWKVSGTVDGKQVRRNFQDRKAALECKQQLEIKQLNGPELGRHMWVKITPEEHDDAFTALRLLKEAGSSRNLTFAVQHLLETFKEIHIKISLAEAVGKFTNAREKDLENKQISEATHKFTQQGVKQFQNWAGDEKILGTVTGEFIEEFLSSLNNGKPSPKTWNNTRGILSKFFKWCYSHRLVLEDPTLRVAVRRNTRARSTAETLSVSQVKEIMDWAENSPEPNKFFPEDDRRGMMVSFLSLALFAGIRPRGEMSKLQPEHIYKDLGIVRVEPEVSKTHELRKVNIQPNLAIWMEKYSLADFPIIPQDIGFDVVFRTMRKQFKIPKDGLRHTYISMLVGAFRTVGDAALQAGNSEGIIKSHYLDLIPMKEAEEFWRIVPKGCTMPEICKIRQEGKYIRMDQKEGHLGIM